MKNTLAIDLGGLTGYAIFSRGEVTFGRELIRKGVKESYGFSYSKALRFFTNLIKDHEIERIYYEDVRNWNGSSAARAYGAYRGMLLASAYQLGLECEGIGVGVIKKHFTGKGRCSKQAMIDRAKKYGFSVVDDNEADALGLLFTIMRLNGEETGLVFRDCGVLCGG